MQIQTGTLPQIRRKITFNSALKLQTNPHRQPYYFVKELNAAPKRI